MSFGRILLAHGLVALPVELLVVLGVIDALIAAAARLFHKEEGLCAALVNEVARKLKHYGIAGRVVHAHQCQLDLLMSGIAVQLALVRTQHAVYVIRHARHYVKQRLFAGRLVVRARGLHHVTRAVQFVIVAQVGPALAGLLDNVVCVQIAVGLLCAAYKRDCLVAGLFQLFIRAQHERIRRRLQPLGYVGILEYAAFKLTLLVTRRDLEVHNAVAGRSALHAVVEYLPLIGDDRIDHLLGHIAQQAL